MSNTGHNTKAADAVTAYLLSALTKAKDEKASSDGKYSSLLSRLQAKDLNLKAAKEALAIHKSGNAAEKVEELQALANYLRILGTPLESDQSDLFAKPVASQTPEEKARENGFGAAILGMNMDQNPHGAETDLGQVWLKAWHDGVKARAKVAQEFEAEEAEETQEDDGGKQADIEDEAA